MNRVFVQVDHERTYSRFVNVNSQSIDLIDVNFVRSFLIEYETLKLKWMKSLIEQEN
jgi:hypothetical protein